jgi:hypothetical protein
MSVPFRWMVTFLAQIIFVREHAVHAGPKDYFVVVVVVVVVVSFFLAS